MPRNPHITIEPRPDGRWAVQKDGTKRASKLFDRQSDAEARGRAQAIRQGAERFAATSRTVASRASGVVLGSTAHNDGALVRASDPRRRS